MIGAATAFAQRALLVASLVLSTAPANAEPASTLKDLWQLLGKCAKTAAFVPETAGSEVTVAFSIKRDGNLQGQPQITHSRLTGDEKSQKAFMGAALASIAACFPLAITDSLGGAVAGRPLRLRVMSRAPERGA